MRQSPPDKPHRAPQPAFTLIELMLVMALLAIMATLVAPRMVSFYRGRVLSLEARRMLALTHQAQDRAIAEGVPVVLWFDPQHSTYGQNIQAGYATGDDRATTYELEPGLTLQVPATEAVPASELGDERFGMTEGLPTILFSPDGFFDFGSVTRLVIRQGTEAALELVPDAERLGYEIRPCTLN